jgi:hypothetical protein
MASSTFASMDRDEMLRREEDGWAALMAAVERVPLDRRSEAGVVPGWSVKDLVWHCGRWADWVREPLERIAAGSYERDREYPWGQMNDDWAEESGGLSWDEVTSGAATMRRDAIAALQALAVVDDDAVREFNGETFEHYAEHAAEIARFAEASA